MQKQLSFSFAAPPAHRSGRALGDDLRDFAAFGTATEVGETRLEHDGRALVVPTYRNEFWTAKQRQANSLHEISYRACFKPQLPRFFIERLTAPGDRVHDPFMGRGTTLLEAALLGRIPSGTDVNPLCAALIGPRLDPPLYSEVGARLEEIAWTGGGALATGHANGDTAGDAADDVAPGDVHADDLRAFFHEDTLREILALRRHLRAREADGTIDRTDRWIRMVALNRLTGHSAGFFSVYTLPPNQAVSADAQRKINRDRAQTPPRRDVRKIVLRKTATLLADCDEHARGLLAKLRGKSTLAVGPAARTPLLADASVALAVTSPPFLDVVDYAGDNWLRAWFAGVDPATVPITRLKSVDAWRTAMTDVFRELARLLAPGGHVAFEVGEVRGGKIRLEEHVVPAGADAGLEPVLILINAQTFTKTANCWGVSNNSKGTNTNRVVVFRKAGTN